MGAGAGTANLVLRLAQLLIEADNAPDSDAANRHQALSSMSQMPNEINADNTRQISAPKLFPVDIDHGLLDSLRQCGGAANRGMNTTPDLECLCPQLARRKEPHPRHHAHQRYGNAGFGSGSSSSWGRKPYSFLLGSMEGRGATRTLFDHRPRSPISFWRCVNAARLCQPRCA